jgi:hypothetical protein
VTTVHYQERRRVRTRRLALRALSFLAGLLMLCAGWIAAEALTWLLYLDPDSPRRRPQRKP